MSCEQRNADFCKAQTDVQMAYIEAEREVNKLKAENERLRSCLSDAAENKRLVMGEYKQLRKENERLRQELAIRDKSEQEKVIDYLSEQSVDWEDRYRALASENVKLREMITDAYEALCADKAGMFHKLILASMEDDMRKLGIEVQS